MFRPLRIVPLVTATTKSGIPAGLVIDILTRWTPCAGCMKLLSVQSFHSRRAGSDGRNKNWNPLGNNMYEVRLMCSESSSSKGAEAAGGLSDTNLEKPSVPKIDTVVKVQPTVKRKPRVKTDFSAIYTANIFITPVRAMNEYLLNSSDLDALKRTKRRSPYPEKEDITVFLRHDVERSAIEKFGSIDNLEREKLLIKSAERSRKSHSSSSATDGVTNLQMIRSNDSIFKHGSGRVVLYAIVVNGINTVVKFAAWLYTGSHSMFSEFIHSLADTVNQLILAIGIHQSLKVADLEHPYGWSNFRNVASLISGVGIFCLGAGMSIYHGAMGLIHPQQAESLLWAMAILGGSFVSEGATLMAAIHQTVNMAKKEQMTFMEYVWRGKDPSTNVVLLEDAAAVLGVAIAASCMAISHYTLCPMADAVGSLIIGSLLGSVASFIIYTNTVSLVGRSIPERERQDMMKVLESDRLIRALHDVKATDMGSSYVRFKAEVDFDGQEVARFYLEKQDLDLMMKEMNKCQTLEEVESFMLKHGENLVDTLGSEVDRIEKNLKRKHPEIRHVDLEQL